MDPYQTGFVSAAEFRDVLQELCVHLSEYELDVLTKKFSVQDGRYIQPCNSSIMLSGKNPYQL